MKRFSKKEIFSIPNLMGYFRILMIPVFCYLYIGKQRYLAASAAVLLSSLTDLFDGKIARKFNMVTELGKLLDPVADKLTHGALALCLALRYPLMWALILLLIVKEGYMAVMGAVLLKKGKKLNGAMWFGKVCTAVLFAGLLVLFLFPHLPLFWVNSLILGVASCAVSAVIGTLGAVGLSRIHWKTKGALEYISILPLMIPEIILGMVLMAFFYMLNLPFGMLTLLIGHTVFCVPYILMEVKARLVGMDPSLEEAARDLGATSLRAFRDITLPLIMPAVASGSLLAFAMSMDDVVISIFINGPRLSTLPIKVYTQIKTGVTPEINALCTIMLAFTAGILLVYSLVKKLRRRSQ